MATTAGHADYDRAMEAYFQQGLERAMQLDNRGPLRFAGNGKLAADIARAYDRYGFYVFEGLIAPRELAELEESFLDMVDRLPTEPGAKLDRKGRPALGAELESPVIYWGKPLSDPFGGTAQAKGRHPVKMYEPKPADDAPTQVVHTIGSQLQLSEACLRLYGHPDVLRIAAALNGEDFVPFQEGIIIKRPGEGRSFAWHQDGTTHWDSPDWNQHIHGTNFMPQLYGSTPANGVWFVPGTQMQGRVDIRDMVARAGSERLPDAVPLVCKAGDMAISNRQILHGSFANTSPDLRVTLNMGFLPYASVLGATGFSTQTGEPVTYDAVRICKRAQLIGYAIDARRQHFPDEPAYAYKPHVRAGDVFHWDETARLAIRGYNLLDLRI